MYRYNTIQYMVNDLHWLPISAHVTHTVLLIVAKSQLGLALKYLCEYNMSKLLSARSSRPVQLADRCDDLVPLFRTALSQNRVFALMGPALWNDSPPAFQNVMLYGISPVSLRSLKAFLSPACYTESTSEWLSVRGAKQITISHNTVMLLFKSQHSMHATLHELHRVPCKL